MVDTSVCHAEKSIHLKHCNGNHYEVVVQIQPDVSQPMHNYFESQRILQPQHLLSAKGKKLIKRVKNKMWKEVDKLCKSPQRQNRSALAKEKEKEKEPDKNKKGM